MSNVASRGKLIFGFVLFLLAPIAALSQTTPVEPGSGDGAEAGEVTGLLAPGCLSSHSAFQREMDSLPELHQGCR